MTLNCLTWTNPAVPCLIYIVLYQGHSHKQFKGWFRGLCIECGPIFLQFNFFNSKRFTCGGFESLNPKYTYLSYPAWSNLSFALLASHWSSVLHEALVIMRNCRPIAPVHLYSTTHSARPNTGAKIANQKSNSLIFLVYLVWTNQR